MERVNNVIKGKQQLVQKEQQEQQKPQGQQVAQNRTQRQTNVAYAQAQQRQR